MLDFKYFISTYIDTIIFYYEINRLNEIAKKLFSLVFAIV